jgi:hypothetical protein
MAGDIRSGVRRDATWASSPGARKPLLVNVDAVQYLIVSKLGG